MLLIVAISTDYWEYRSFNRTYIRTTFEDIKRKQELEIRDRIQEERQGFGLISDTAINQMGIRRNTIGFREPGDTKSFFNVTYYQIFPPKYEEQEVTSIRKYNESYYQPPALLQKMVTLNITYNATNGNITIPGPIDVEKASKHVIVIFQQYGNLFRDCDDLEGNAL